MFIYSIKVVRDFDRMALGFHLYTKSVPVTTPVATCFLHTLM
jgi:hypothetical protein